MVRFLIFIFFFLLRRYHTRNEKDYLPSKFFFSCLHIFIECVLFMTRHLRIFFLFSFSWCYLFCLNVRLSLSFGALLRIRDMEIKSYWNDWLYFFTLYFSRINFYRHMWTTFVLLPPRNRSRVMKHLFKLFFPNETAKQIYKKKERSLYENHVIYLISGKFTRQF